VRRQAELIGDAFAELGVARRLSWALVRHTGRIVARGGSASRDFGARAGVGVLLSNPSGLDPLPFGLPGIPVIGDLYRYTLAPLGGWLIAPAMIRKVFAPSRALIEGLTFEEER
jgi:hypothetical protein